MKNINSRLKSLEKELADIQNPLIQIREDLKPILKIKKAIDYQNRFNNSLEDSSKWFGGVSKETAIDNGILAIKNIVIELAKKYQEELV